MMGMMIRWYYLYKPFLHPTPHFYEYEGVVGGDDEALLVTIHDAALATIEPRWCHSSHSSPLDMADGYSVIYFILVFRETLETIIY